MDRQLPPFIVREQNAARLKAGVAAWNKWREANPAIEPDLIDVDLRGIDLGCTDDSDLETENSYEQFENVVNLQGAVLFGAKLNGANLRRANLNRAKLADADLSGANLVRADLSHADMENTILCGAKLHEAKMQGAQLLAAKLQNAELDSADLRGADLSLANCTGANFTGTSLSWTDLTNTTLAGADLSYAHLNYARLVETRLGGATLTGAAVYGIAAWNLDLEKAVQSSLVITPAHEPEVTVDDLEVAQFVYLLLRNENLRKVIDTIGNRAVLILGRFKERKEVLEAIREGVRQRELLPIVFDFERPTDRDLTETVMTLAGMSRFIVADITKPRSVPLELHATVPNYMIPFVPIIQEGEKPFAMFRDLWQKYRDWVLEPRSYDSLDALLRNFDNAVVQPANDRLAVLRARKAEPLIVRRVEEYQ